MVIAPPDWSRPAALFSTPVCRSTVVVEASVPCALTSCCPFVLTDRVLPVTVPAVFSRPPLLRVVLPPACIAPEVLVVTPEVVMPRLPLTAATVPCVLSRRAPVTVVLPLAASVPATLVAAPLTVASRSPTAVILPLSLARLPACTVVLPPAPISPLALLSSRAVTVMPRWEVSAARIVPPLLLRLPAATCVLPLLARVPASLFNAPTTVMRVAPDSPWTMLPPWLLKAPASIVICWA